MSAGGLQGAGIIIGANTRNIEKHVHRVKHTDANIQLDSNERWRSMQNDPQILSKILMQGSCLARLA